MMAQVIALYKRVINVIPDYGKGESSQYEVQ